MGPLRPRKFSRADAQRTSEGERRGLASRWKLQRATPRHFNGNHRNKTDRNARTGQPGVEIRLPPMWLIATTKAGAIPMPINPARAIKRPIVKPRTSFGRYTVKATDMMSAVIVPHSINIPMPRAKSAGDEASGYNAAGMPPAAAATMPSNSPPRILLRVPRSQAGRPGSCRLHHCRVAGHPATRRTDLARGRSGGSGWAPPRCRRRNRPRC